MPSLTVCRSGHCLVGRLGYGATANLGDDAGECVATCEGHQGIVTGVAFSASGGFIASLGVNATVQVKLVVWRPARL